MSDHHADLTSAMEALQQAFQECSSRLAEKTGDTLTSGRPPSDELIRDLLRARERFLDFREEVLHRAASEQLSYETTPEDLPALAELVRRIQQHSADRAERERRQGWRRRALEVLDRVGQITHRSGTPFDPLAACQDQARALREAVRAESDAAPWDEVQKLANGEHAYCDLLALIESDDLDDSRWDALLERSSAAFGKPLTIAGARGRLAVPGVNGAPPARAASPAVANGRHEPAAAPATGNGAAVEAGDDEGDSIFDRGGEVHLGGSSMTQPEGHRHRPLAGDVWVRSPLTEVQEEALAESRHGVDVLFGSRLAGLEDVERALQDVCRGRQFTLEQCPDQDAFLTQLDDLLGDRPDGLIQVIVPDFCPWDADWILAAVKRVFRPGGEMKVTRLLFLADPQRTWDWTCLDDDVHAKLQAKKVAEYRLGPWTEGALNAWMTEAGIQLADARERGHFAKATGRWGELVHQLGARCRSIPKRCREHLAGLERELAGRPEWLERLGIVPDAWPVLKAMADHDGPTHWDELCALPGELSPLLLARVIRWGEKLHYVRQHERLRWDLDPVVRGVLAAAPVERPV